MGDFNAALYIEDSFCGSSNINIAMREFRECVDNIEVSDVNSTGLHFTWNQKPNAETGMFKKIDRVMRNLYFTSEFPGSYVIFQPYRISDHSPAVLKIQQVTKIKPKPFKFSNFIVYKSEFKPLVEEGWKTMVSGHTMFKVVKKMRLLKKPIRKLVMNQGNLHSRVVALRQELDEVQKSLDKDPLSTILREEEAFYLKSFNEAVLDEERFLKQKAKVEWLRVGDSNTAFFHKMVKSKINRSRIEAVLDANNVMHEGTDVIDSFVTHYSNFLGVQGSTSPLNTTNLFLKRLDVSKALNMCREVSNKEVKEAMFSIGNNKAPGPDGYSSLFFKNHGTSWVSTPSRINDYRPISCCNVIYKCISKIITSRLKEGLDDVVSDNQSAFVPARSISDNILITQELMHNYNLNRGPPRRAFKVNIQKAYDTVDWNFLQCVLVGFGFHPKMITWIMACVTSTSYSLCINGELHDYFKGKRGIRQGDPMSPYLFTMIIEILTLILMCKVKIEEGFQYHNYCQKQKIINMCFADDLILFARGDVNSARIIMEALDEFKVASGLVPSVPKSTAFFCNVPNHVKMSILHIMPFEAGDMKRGKAKVAWDHLCLPKYEGRLGTS
ncbi:hypothetical protein Tco_0989765 [Tanacetum coccineum]|uniref:Reverse transcriptase domain-containing protein n=1 Tax=Tanacetum coccineum TaxID=301880 RepID=A0ABQ5EUJ4_9ASTR